MIEVKIDYDSVNTIFKIIGRSKTMANNMGIDLLRKSAQDYVNALKANIDTQAFGDFGVPMNKKWKQAKTKTASDTSDLFWYWLGTLYQNINFTEISNGRYRVYVESKQTAHGNPAYYASINEFRRPLFHRTYEQFKTEWNKNCKEFFNHIKKAAHS